MSKQKQKQQGDEATWPGVPRSVAHRVMGDAGPDFHGTVAWVNAGTGEFGVDEGHQWRVHPSDLRGGWEGPAEGDYVSVVSGVVTVTKP